MERTRVNGRHELAGIFIVVLLSLLFRRYDAFSNPQLWAEDGPVFLQQFMEKGIGSVFTPYAGYLHTAQRLIVLFFGTIDFNLMYIPLLFNSAVVLIVYLLAVHLWRSSAALHINNRIAYATFFLFAPIASDVFMNITNLNGMLSLYLVNFLFLRYTGASKFSYWTNAFIILVISLSGPGSLLLVPVVLLIIILERKEISIKGLLPLLLILVGGVIQLVCIKFIDTGFYRGVGGATERYHLAKFFTNNVSDLLFMNYDIWPDIPRRARNDISLVVLLLVAVYFIRCYLNLAYRRKYVIVLAAILYTASVIIAYWPNESHLTALGNASRYFIVPYTLVGWIFILALDRHIKWIHISCYLLFLFFHSRSIKFALTDKHWGWQIMEYRQGKRDKIDINPEGWKLTIPPKVKK